MPNLTSIRAGLVLMDRGLAFTTVATHPLDSNLWRVRYNDGHEGVFDSEWLLALANATPVAEAVRPPLMAITEDVIEPVEDPI